MANQKRAVSTFIAYYYPGWHRSSWKDFDEWGLLDEKRPCFPGHEPLDGPLSGPYDDTSKPVVGQQMATAQHYGVAAFSFFFYHATGGYVLEQPFEHALALSADSAFKVSATWCLRLPHQYFPIPLGDDDAPIAVPELPQEKASEPLSLRRLIPEALLDTPVSALCDWFAPANVTPVQRGAPMSMAMSMVPQKLVPREVPRATIRQVVDLLTGIAADPDELGGWPLAKLERHLGLVGLLDLQVRSLLLLMDRLHLEAEVLDTLTAEDIVLAFEETDDTITAQDLRRLAALGMRAANDLEVLETVTVDELKGAMSLGGMSVFSLRDIRAALEGIAHDTAARDT
ncbi:glycosyl transferase family WbsX [Asanoa ferruginea]|uniref:Glycosyl transferase family WbsX n=1 Tax=Asanoa ferruginea TaxID=53367 RepID=A0A3D9ZV19_9ACTN|nr:glycoside hydrolase family 99-like domain-containing protein [Asanoa ferruginea]REG01018.1 glycosyl transferase family WbsX [Asanoa ferruginea]GIF47618.1 hypothetical protein Afe04nite_21570 [Asanoa ferruginea]